LLRPSPFRFSVALDDTVAIAYGWRASIPDNGVLLKLPEMNLGHEE